MTAWTDFATGLYKKEKAKNANFTFSDALKKAGKLYKKGGQAGGGKFNINGEEGEGDGYIYETKDAADLARTNVETKDAADLARANVETPLDNNNGGKRRTKKGGRKSTKKGGRKSAKKGGRKSAKK